MEGPGWRECTPAAAKADEELPLPACYSYWESVYERELDLARVEPEEDASSNSDEPPQSDGDYGESRLEGEGEEWFEAQSDAVADWVVTSLRTSPFCTRWTDRSMVAGAAASEHTVVCGTDGFSNSPAEARVTGQQSTPILDVGCGNGRFLLRLLRRGCRCVVGVDYSRAAIRMAYRNLRKVSRVHRYRNVSVCLAVADVGEAEPSAVDSGGSCKFSGCCRLCHKGCVGGTATLSPPQQKEARRIDAGLASVPVVEADTGTANDGEPCPNPSGDSGDALAAKWASETASENAETACETNTHGKKDLAVADSARGGLRICYDGNLEATDLEGSMELLPRASLPRFPVIHDKGTFDVFYLLRAPAAYVRRVWGLLAPGGILFLTSCNCTRSELEELFSRSQNGETRYLFEIIGELRHKTFKFAGVEGQVVTSLMLRRIECP